MDPTTVLIVIAIIAFFVVGAARKVHDDDRRPPSPADTLLMPEDSGVVPLDGGAGSDVGGCEGGNA